MKLYSCKGWFITYLIFKLGLVGVGVGVWVKNSSHYLDLLSAQYLSIPNDIILKILIFAKKCHGTGAVFFE